MKRYFLIFLLMLLVPLNAYAIRWDTLRSPAGNDVYLDVDSITDYKGYYFYNIKFKKPNSKDHIILTVQSAKAHPFSARLKTYSESEYEALKGDYENITAKMTTKLEPVTYQSSVNTCYKRVKLIIQYREKQNILLNE